MVEAVAWRRRRSRRGCASLGGLVATCFVEPYAAGSLPPMWIVSGRLKLVQDLRPVWMTAVLRSDNSRWLAQLKDTSGIAKPCCDSRVMLGDPLQLWHKATHRNHSAIVYGRSCTMV